MNEAKRGETSPPLSTINYPNWPSGSRPATPALKMFFYGLIGFGYSRTHDRAEVVFNDGDERHNLTISASQDGVPINLNLPSPITKIELGLAQTPQVYFLQDGSSYDFGQVLNLNGPDFYPGKLPTGEFGVRLVVNHGTFFTTTPTHFRFTRHTVPPVIPFPPGHATVAGQKYAEVVNAEIGSMAGGVAVLKVNDTPIQSFPIDPGRSAEIKFDNLCREGGKLCKHNPKSWLESSRGDFHYHREVLNISSILDPRYELIIGTGQVSDRGIEFATGQKPRSNDLSPCMGVGYGDSDGLPGA